MNESPILSHPPLFCLFDLQFVSVRRRDRRTYVWQTRNMALRHTVRRGVAVSIACGSFMANSTTFRAAFFCKVWLQYSQYVSMWVWLGGVIFLHSVCVPLGKGEKTNIKKEKREERNIRRTLSFSFSLSSSQKLHTKSPPSTLLLLLYSGIWTKGGLFFFL